MKQFRFLTMAALIAFGTAVCAQNVITLDEMQARKKQQQQQPQQQQVVQEKVSYSSGSDYESFGTFFLQYNPTWMAMEMKEGSLKFSDTQLGHGISLGYIQSIPLGIPLYIEFGAAVQYIMWSYKPKVYDLDYEDYYDYYGYDDFGGSSDHKQKYNLLSVKIPVDVMYSFDINDGFSIQPYAGMYTRINIIGKGKYGNGDSYSVFSKDDMGGKDGTWNRFQVGLQAGCKFRFGQKFTAGIGYFRDILPKLYKYDEHGYKETINLYGLDVTLGLTF